MGEMIICRNAVRMRGIKRLVKVYPQYSKSGGKDDSKGKNKS